MTVKDRDMEQAALSCVLLSATWLPKMLEVGLRAEHFYSDDERACFEAMVLLYDEGHTIDTLTVGRRSKLDQEFVAFLSSAAPQASSALTYAKQLVALGERRKLMAAGQLLSDAGASGDLELREQAEALLASRTGSENKTYNPDQLVVRFFDRLERGEGKAWPLPSVRLNKLVGGLRPGEVTLIGGWTSHGKSVLLDDILCHVSDYATAHLFINEMTADERVDRMVAKRTGIPSMRVSNKDELSQDELKRVVQAITGLPYGITEAAGWTVQEIRREIRRRNYDVVGVDIIHLIEYREERDLAQISRVLNIAAKETGCHILATVHLKDERLKSAVPPPPTLSDIKGAGSLKQDADNVMFVYRECDEMGSPQSDSKIWFAKARQGQTGGINASFIGNRMTFEMETF